MTSMALAKEEATDVLSSLQSVCTRHGLETMSAKLAELASLVQWDMQEIAKALAELPQRSGLVHRSARHLVDLGGKRLRPICVALASKVGSGFDEKCRDLAVAVELVHCATLLHDDVIDHGDRRRGSPTARSLYGNAASIFAGDWLLIEALKRVRATKVPDTLERLLDIIDEMIAAESLQLEGRGRLELDPDRYFRVVEGKTAALFRWAMFAGGRGGGLDLEQCRALERFGAHLGIAFQLVDDLLDYAGDAEVTGKVPFADLREGKATYPLIVAVERDPDLLGELSALVERPDEQPEARFTAVRDRIESTGALTRCHALALEHANQAQAALSGLPPGPAVEALGTVAETTVNREL